MQPRCSAISWFGLETTLPIWLNLRTKSGSGAPGAIIQCSLVAWTIGLPGALLAHTVATPILPLASPSNKDPCPGGQATGGWSLVSIVGQLIHYLAYRFGCRFPAVVKCCGLITKPIWSFSKPMCALRYANGKVAKEIIMGWQLACLAG